MQQITATARILGADGKPVARLSLHLEVFSLARGWLLLAEAQTAEDGAVTLSGRPEPLPQNAAPIHAPALRLVEKSGDTGPRVLATGGVVAYGGARRPLLTVDFGEVQRLDDTRFALRSTRGEPQEAVHVVAGVPRPADRTEATPGRILGDRVPIGLGTTIDRSVAAGGTIATGDAAANQPFASVSADRFNAEILSFSARETTLRGEISARDLLIAQNKRRVEELEDAAGKAAARAEAAEREKAEAAAEAAALREAASREAPIQSIALSIGKEAAAANTAMEAEAAGFRIAKMQVSLQGSVAPGGDRIALATAADALKGGAGRPGLQGLVIDYVPDRKPVAPAPEGTPVPDVLGLTESAARRALSAAGLGISVATRPGAATGRFAVGQAVQQAPAAGQPLPPGETVIVVFAAP